jgi:non-lysosomal glucosylceramidase
MIEYSSKDNVKSGVPLGGIGAGKLEITPSGLFNAFTFQNNWSNPLSGNEDYPGILGFHMGVSAEATDSEGGKKAFLLQTVPVLDLPCVKKIDYQGTFPHAKLVYSEPSLGLDVSLVAMSPLIPFDAKNSSLPAVSFTLKIKNVTKKPLKAGFIFIGRNTVGEWCVGRKNRVRDEKKQVYLEFSNTDPSPRDVQQGTLAFSFLKKGWQTSFIENWNAVTKNFYFNPQNIALLAWDYFLNEGVLPNTSVSDVVQGENQEICGSLMASRVVNPGEEATLEFAASWFFPKHPLGHIYENWFKNAGQASDYLMANKSSLKKKTKDVESAVYSLPFPEWFNSALLTNLAPFFSASWQVRDGRFAFYEAPIICPLMGTIDVGFYGSIPLSYFFPELEISQITQFANAQRKDGYIPHDLGRNRIDLPSNGTTFYFWKDLNPKFILMVYRDYLWSGNEGFLRKMLPHVKKAIQWTLKTDIDGNGLPDNEGADQTFDLWGFYGTNAYTSGIFLAALLAAEKMGKLLGDERLAAQCRKDFLKGSFNFDKELWNGEFFGDTCALSQLNGQWYSDLLKLGTIAEPVKIQKAIRFILKHNTRHSRFGMVNSVRADGVLDASNDHSKNVWSGMNYAFISLCISQGHSPKAVLKEAEKIWDNVTRVQKNPWSLPDTIDSKTGKYVFGDSYYRNMAIWSIPIAFAKRDEKTARVLKMLRELKGKGR